MSTDTGRRHGTRTATTGGAPVRAADPRRVATDPRARRAESATPRTHGRRAPAGKAPASKAPAGKAPARRAPASRASGTASPASSGRTPASAPARQQRNHRGRSAPALQKRVKSTKRTKHAKRQPAGLLLTFRAGEPRRRLVAVFVISVLLFAAVVARVAFLQTAGSESLVAAGKAQRVSEAVLYAPRGTIFARDGGELVMSVPSSTLIANPKLVTDPTGVSSVLATMLQLPQEKQQALLAAFTAKDKSFVYIARQIDDDIAGAVMSLNLSGIDVLREDKRIMPSGEVGRSLLGRTDIDGIGTAGLELLYNEELTGVEGERVREHDAKGRSIPGSGATTTDPVPGDDLVLTLDRSLQFQVEQALLTRVEELKAAGGAVVVMDVATGEIYAIANVSRGDDGIVAVTSANLAAVEPFEPGSVAKVFSLSSVVDTGVANPGTVIEVPGKIVYDRGTPWMHTITDAEPHGTQPMSLRDIIVHSSNIGTLLLTDEVGTERFGAYLESFGFGQKTALDFPNESAGLFKPASEWQGTERQSHSYGYGYSVTALQLAAAVNTVANGGVYVAPKLVEAVIGADGEVTDTPAAATHQVIQPATAATMTDMMKGVVCEGTGKGAQIPGISVAGKTGTAYKVQDDNTYGAAGTRAYRASFVGYFPADAPRVTILVTIDEPDPTSNDRFGGKAAAPLFSSIATAAIHELQITPTPGDSGCRAAG
jgi:cell division protein FtsI (penicillin-binding protein 3)